MLELTNRQIKILKIVVEHYNMYGTTISSSDLQEQFGLSSATLRKELNFLEKQGFLEKRHTSSGRIPTKKGYELYIRMQMQNKNPLSVNSNVDAFLKTIHDININTIEQTLDEVSKLTNYTALAFESNFDEVVIKAIKSVKLDDYTVILIVSTSNNKNESNTIVFKSTYELEQFIKIISSLDELLNGVLINKVDKIIDSYIKDHLHEELEQYIEYLQFIAIASKKFTKPNMYLSGTSHLFDQAINSDKVKNLITKLENSNFEDFTVKANEQFDFEIGENEDDYTIIKVNPNSEDFRSLALVGPKRMNYEEILILLDHLSKNIK